MLSSNLLDFGKGGGAGRTQEIVVCEDKVFIMKPLPKVRTFRQ
jgi:hypothetical protein